VPLRVLFFGTPSFAIPTLRALLDSDHEVVGVVTQPDRPRDRGRKVQPPPVKLLAEARGVAILQPDTLKGDASVGAMRALAPDLGVVAAYGKLLPESVLAVPRLGLINVHASLLPRHRGASPVHAAVAAGDIETGVTIMRVVKALDAGPVLARARTAIGSEETSGDVEARLAEIGGPLLVTVVDRLAAGPVEEEAQDESLATYAPRLTKADGLIVWMRSARQVHDHVRAMHPWPGAFTFVGALRLAVHRTEPRGPVSAPPGTLVEAHGDSLVVATGDAGSIALVEVQPAGRRAVTAREFLAGHPVDAGALLPSSIPT
jgi:methionyl-tRNA formyltransferase